MTFTKVTNTGIGSTGTVLLQNLDVIGIATAGFGVSTVDVFTTGITTFANATDSTSTTTGSVIVSGGVGIAGSLNVGGSVSVGGTLTYEDVTNVDSVGIITARSNILVGSGITLSPDGDVFTVGVSTFRGDVNVSGRVRVTGPSTITNNAQTIMAIDSADDNTAGLGGKIGFAAKVNETTRTLAAVGGLKSIAGTGNFSGDLALYTRQNGVANLDERLRITSEGNIGIGTTNPSTPLHVLHPTTNGVATFESGDAFCSVSFRDINTSTSAPAIGAQGDTLRFVTYDGSSSSEKLRITGAGAIGLSGGNYGSDNQALTSKGSSSAVEWRGINSPCWFGRQDTAHNVATGAWTTILNLGNSVINPSSNNGGWNESTGIFTVQSGQAGLYYVYGQAAIDDIQDNDIVRAGFSKNDGTVPLYTQMRTIDQGANVIVNSGLIAQTVELAVGDTIKLQVYHNEGSTEPTEPIYCFFGGYRLSI